MGNTKMIKEHECIVIGGGAAGMMAAITLAGYGIDVCILEHTPKIGTKILQTGNGKCNFTNLYMDESMYQNEDKKWVMDVISRFTVSDTLEFFKKIGVYYKQKNGYVYPLSMTAASLQNALRLELENKKIRIHTNTIVNNILKLQKKDGKFKIECEGIDYIADAVIIATGSRASSKTGSDGSGYELVKKLGINVVKPLPALVQLVAQDKKLCSIAAGVRSNGKVGIFVDGVETAKDTGEIQYTDYGISGIPVFQVSRYAVKALDEKKDVQAYIDMLPDIDDKDTEYILEYRIINEGYKTVEQFFEGMINKKLAAMVCRRCNVDKGSIVSKLKISEIKKLIDCMKNFNIHIVGDKGFESGQICQGGVDLNDVSSSDMQSKKVKGIFFAGEVLDVDGKCGGYNLQWAWSSARAAAGGVKKYIEAMKEQDRYSN